MKKNFPKNLHIFSFIFVFLCLSSSAAGQDLPDKIRGYKVHKAEILVQNDEINNAQNDDLRVEAEFGEPELADVSLSGITLELGGTLTVFGQSGTIDFISFRDFRVNDIAVEIEEYRESFNFKKGEPFELKKPVKIFVGLGQTLHGAAKEFKDAKDEWAVKGRVFVFGRFKKFGFHFKRVIPVQINLKIKNPLKNQN